MKVGEITPGHDLPEHLGHVVVDQISIGYSFAGSRKVWTSGRLTLNAKAPKTDADIAALWEDLARKGCRQMLRTPPASMRRTIG